MQNKIQTNYSSKLQKLFLCFGIMTVLASSANAQISLSSTTGTTSGSYTTLNAAFTAINAGTHTGVITINITGNTNEPDTPVPLLKSGTGSSSYTRILIRPSGGNRIINSGTAPITNRSFIELTGADNVTIDGDDPATAGVRNLTIQAAQVSTVGVGCISLCSNSTSGADGADNDTVMNCIIIGPRLSATAVNVNYAIRFMNGISATTTGAYRNQNTVIMNNEIKRAYHGLFLVGASTTYPNSGIRILNNIIGSTVTNDNIAFRGMYITYSSTTSTATSGNMQIIGNDIMAGSYTTTGYNLTVAGIELNSYNVGAKILNNTIHDIRQPSTSTSYGAYGIAITTSTQTSGITIANNYISGISNGNTSASLTIAGIPACLYFSSGPTNCYLVNNTMVLPQQISTNTSKSSVAIRTSANTTFAQFLNNIAVNNHNSSNAHIHYSLATKLNPIFSSGVMDNNVYFVNTVGKVGYFDGVSRPSIQSWKDATRQDVNTFLENPPFVSATDLHLTAGSYTACESAGAATSTTGITTDYDGQTRPGSSTYGFGTKPDIGADEFNGRRNYTCTAPSPGATVCTPTTICLGESITLTTNISSFTGTGIYYQWQRSNNGTSFTDISGEVFSLLTETPDKAYYYRVKVSCINGSVGYSTPVQVAYFNDIVTTTTGQRCGTGTVNLSATGTTGSSLKWYDAASGGALLGSGPSLTTPSIGSTTDFYVAAGQVSTESKNINPGLPTYGYYEPASPFMGLYYSTKTQYVVPASYLQNAGFTAGNINSLSMYVMTFSTYDGGVLENFTIKMAHTSTGDLSAGFLSPTFTTVWGADDYEATVGDNTFTFSSPFLWDGTSNIVIQMCFDNTSSFVWPYYASVRTFNTPQMSTYQTWDDYNNLCSVMYGDYGDYGDYYLPDFTFNGQVICSGPRVPVSAIVNPLPSVTVSPATTPTSICAGQTKTFTTTSPGTYQWRNASGHLAGETSSSLTVGTAGTYRLVLTNPATGCKDSSSPIVLNVNPLPTISVSPSGPTNICADSVITLKSTSTGVGLSFKWFKDGVLLSSETKDSIKTTFGAGTYKIAALSGTCSDTSNLSVVNHIPLPSSTFLIDDVSTAICLGGSLKLAAEATPTGYTYQWFVNDTLILGATSKDYTANSPGIYSVKITDLTNCRKMSDTMTIINSPLGIPSITPNEIDFCEGNTALLLGSGGMYAVKYEWEKSGVLLPDTIDRIPVTESGIYSVVVKDIYNCVAKSTNSIVNVFPMPSKPTIIQTGSTLTTSTAYNTYQWYRNGVPMAGGSTRTVPISFDGKYYVRVTNTEDCFNISETMVIQNLSVKEVLPVGEMNISIYPNPSQNIINISAPKEVNLIVSDIQGKRLLELKDAKQVDMSVYADGIYLFTVTDKEGQILKMDKVVKSTN